MSEDFPVTDEQTAIISHDDGPAAKIVAYAGTGKTKTLELYAKAHDEPMLYLAFNKSVQTEAEKRFPWNVRCQTIHALAYRTIRPTNVKGFLSFIEVARFLNCPVEVAVGVVDTVEAYQNSGKFEITSDTCPFRNPADPKDVEVRELFADAARKVFAATGDGRLPMTHGRYLKEYQLSRPRINTRTILLDEAQDTNPVILDVIKRQGHCRIISVGDPYQQIYAWTGAIDAMNNLGGDTFYLTKSFRFGPSVAAAASQLLDAFYTLPKPLKGLETVNTEILTAECTDEAETLPKPYTHIFRSNAGLFAAAVGYAKAGMPIALTGGQTFQVFLDDLMNLYHIFNKQPDACKHPTYRVFKTWEKLKAWATVRSDSQLSGKMEIVEDNGHELPRVIQRVLAACVPDEKAKVLLVTAHRAKGMQWENVKLADDFAGLTDEIGNPLTVTDNPVEGDAIFTHINSNEVHLVYVALTRAIRRVRVNSSFLDVIQQRPNEFLRRVRAARSSGHGEREAHPTQMPFVV